MARFLILLNLGHHGWLSAMGAGGPLIDSESMPLGPKGCAPFIAAVSR
jgi:hypothetical protein